MPLSRIAHTASDGTDLFAVVSLGSLRSLDTAKITALAQLEVRTVADLLHFTPVHDARLLVLAAQGRLGHELDRASVLRPEVRDVPLTEIPARAPVDVLPDIDADDQLILKTAFGVQTVAQLAAFSPVVEAERFLSRADDQFHEPASAPDQLMPRTVGSTRTSVGFSTFVKERTIRLEALQLGYDVTREPFVAGPFTGLFAVAGLRIDRFPNGRPAPVPEFHLAHVARLRQVWTNEGTHLGEVIHSLALAPGESRNIAVLDWKHRQATRRNENTRAEEQLTNVLFHTRALEEVTRSTATEHQFGGTKIEASTVATSLAATAGVGVAGALAGSATGAAIGALVGAPAAGVGAVPGALAGLLIGGTVGAAVAIGASGVFTAAGQSGTVESDSGGDREIVARVAQDITETTIQKASSVRSLWSTVIVTDEQASTETISSRNVTNYNHSHTLNIEYFEILQRYRTEIGLAAADPLLLLPFRPLDFDIYLIALYWDRLRVGVSDPVLRERFDEALRILGPPEDTAADSRIARVTVVVQLPRGAFSGLGGFNPLLGTATPSFPTEIRLLGLDESDTFLGTTTVIRLENPADAAALTGISLENPDLAGLETTVQVSVRLVAPDGAPVNVERLGSLTFDDGGLATFGFDVLNDPEPSPGTVREIERHLNDRRYGFTRLLLVTMEREQLVDLVEALVLSIRPRNGRPTTNGPFVPMRLDIAEVVTREVSGDLTDGTDVIVAEVVRSVVTRRGTATAEVEAVVSAFTGELATALERAGIGQGQAKILTAHAAARLQAALAEFGTDAARPLLDGVHLTEFVEPGPIAITDNAVVLRMRTVTDQEVLDRGIVQRHLQDLVRHPAQIAAFVAAGQAAPPTATEIFLPTSGVFAEGILGRANSSEKVDATRYTHWDESPIPHQAPLIAPLVAGQQGNPPLDMTPTVPGSVLNIVNPPAFPDPTGLATVLAAVQNGAIFRDQSGAGQLTSTLGSLAQVASTAAQQSADLAGEAREQALASATKLATTVADLLAAAAQTAPSPATAPPQTNTEKAGALNLIDRAPAADAASPEAEAPDTPADRQARKEQVLGVRTPATAAQPGPREVSFTVLFVDLDGLPFTGPVGIALLMDFGATIDLADVVTTDVPPNGVHQDVATVDPRDLGGTASIELLVPAADQSLEFRYRGRGRFEIPTNNVVVLVVSPRFETFEVTTTKGESHREKKVEEDTKTVEIGVGGGGDFAAAAGEDGVFDVSDIAKVGVNGEEKLALSVKGSFAYSDGTLTGEEREDTADDTTVTVATVKRGTAAALDVHQISR